MANCWRIYLLAVSVGFFFSLSGTELLPWFGDQLNFDWRGRLLYQNYTHIKEGNRSVNRTDNDLFLTLSLSNSPQPEVSIELETTLAHTRHKSNCLDNIRITGRWLFLDDVAGDPVSFSAGLTYTNAFKGSLRDISSFHHGHAEFEGHVAFGKEISCRTMWLSRWWTVATMGMAEIGSPWSRAISAYEYRMGEQHEIRLFFEGLWGWGNHLLHQKHFRGYGLIAHRSIDLGLRYTYLIPYFGHLFLEYTYRVYARNFPANCQRVTVEILY